MARSFVVDGIILLVNGYVYFTTVLPLMLDAGGLVDEAQATYALFMHALFLIGLVFVQFGALPRVVAVRTREEAGEGERAAAAAAAAEEEEEEGEDKVPAKGYEEEEKDDVPAEGEHEKEE